MAADGIDGVHHAFVIVAAVEVGIVEPALELETRLKDFGWHVERRCG